MNVSKQRALVVFWAVAGLVSGLIIVLLWGTEVRTALEVLGALMIGSGLWLLLKRHLFKVDPDRPVEQIAVLGVAIRRIRVVGATSVVMGVAQLVPDEQVRMVLTGCAAVLSLAAAFKIPRRFFSESSVP